MSNKINNKINSSNNSDIIYKGWILTYQDSNGLSSPSVVNSHSAEFQIFNIKWMPKFAVISQQHKCVLLYDYEATNETILNHFVAFGSNSSDSPPPSAHLDPNAPISISTYRLDNSIRHELFLNYWRNKSATTNPDYFKYNDLTSSDINNQNSNLLSALNNANHHHLSNKDIELIDKDSLNSFSTNPSSNQTNDTLFSNLNITSSNNTASSQANGTFRFAGLFFKKDKAEKAKHSSLKRAKSGIQLERKKPIVNSASTNCTSTASNSSMKSTASATLNTTNSMHPSESNRSISNNNNNISNTTGNNPGAINENYDGRNSLPSPMRPSRSHESLSPLKPSSNPLHSSSTQDTQFIRLNQNSSTMINSKSNRGVGGSGTDYYSAPMTPSIYSKFSAQHEIVDNLVRLDLNNTNQSPHATVQSIHNSLLNEENCFKLKCYGNLLTVFSSVNKCRIREKNGADNDDQEDLDYDDDYDDDFDDDDEQLVENQFDTNDNERINKKSSNRGLKLYTSSVQYVNRYFKCRTSDERDKWIQCLRNVSQPNLMYERHDENSLQVWLLEAKGQTISSKPNKKYFCDILLNSNLHARTCCKDKKEILFWGESFDFNAIQCDYLRVELYQETIETSKKKIKKEKEKDNGSNYSAVNGGKDVILGAHSSNHTLLGFVNIPVTSIESNQPIEKWYRLEPPSSANDIYSNPPSQSSSSSDSALPQSTSQTSQSGTSNSSTSLTTTQNFSKDSISIRIKAKYQSVDILPLNCYHRLIDFIREKYLNLMLTLEPHLNVRIKDDLANSLVRIAHKLQIQTKFLTDLVLAEVLQLEDNSLTFRGNSLATKAMESYMKLVGENYLKQTLSDCVRSIIDTSHDLEIDPSKVSNQSNLQTNREELVQILHLVCGRVFNSCVHFPSEMKNVFACLRSECKRHGKTDEMCDTLISASIFLRFICPAILSPNLFNLTQEYPQEKAARKLTLAAKTLQTIANFSKFGGKEFYMSFDKMNQFVDEHTILMREFLRNISTHSEDPNENFQSEANNNRVLPIITLTPQTPKSMRRHTVHQELNFDLELIDLGKQLSILHGLLTSILAGFEEPIRSKFDQELIDILNEITSLKKNSFRSNSAPNSMIVMQQPPPPVHQQTQLAGNSNNNPNNKLYSYENRLHYAIMKNQNLTQKNSSPITPSNSSATTPTSVNTSTEQPNSSSSSSSSRYSSQVTLNIIGNSAEITSKTVKSTTDQAKQLETEINLLKQKLRDTELSLKKEQTEKYLIEYKLKQQQQDNDQQMRNIINRLIKVEEELRKEQNEMHKLLKAKQDLIEIQKKRIEYLTNRQQQSQTVVSSNLSSNHPSLNYSQHQHQPKQRQSNRSQLKGQNNLNPSLTNASNSASNPSINSVDYNDPMMAQSNILPKAQIAASPSSSSASMTQFCSYLAANSMIKTNPNSSNNSINGTSITGTNGAASSVAVSHLNNKISLVDHAVVSPSSSSSSASSTLSSTNNQNHNQASNNSAIINF